MYIINININIVFRQCRSITFRNSINIARTLFSGSYVRNKIMKLYFEFMAHPNTIAELIRVACHAALFWSKTATLFRKFPSEGKNLKARGRVKMNKVRTKEICEWKKKQDRMGVKSEV
jgi:hypothetical protein